MIGGRLLSVTALVALCVGSTSALRAASAPDLRELQVSPEPTVDGAAEPVPSPTVTLVGDTSVCGAEGDRTVTCGATNTDRPHLCCPGLTCIRTICGVVPECGTEGMKAKECGVQQENRPDFCCEGFGCDPVTKECREGLTSAPTPEPEAFVPIDPALDNCAIDGERAQDCGATSSTRPQSCCPGHICNPRATVFNCILDPAASTSTTSEPTPMATDPPTVSVGTPEPTTEMPTTATIGDTGTPAPTSDLATVTEPTIIGLPFPEDLPTAGPTASTPEPSTEMPTTGTEIPTEEPTTEPPSPKPTEAPTPMVTTMDEVEGDSPPSAASILGAPLHALAAACLFAPLLLLP